MSLFYRSKVHFKNNRFHKLLISLTLKKDIIVVNISTANLMRGNFSTASTRVWCRTTSLLHRTLLLPNWRPKSTSSGMNSNNLSNNFSTILMNQICISNKDSFLARKSKCTIVKAPISSTSTYKKRIRCFALSLKVALPCKK